MATELDTALLRVQELERALSAEQEARKEATSAAGSKDLLSMELADYQVCLCGRGRGLAGAFVDKHFPCPLSADMVSYH